MSEDFNEQRVAYSGGRWRASTLGRRAFKRCLWILLAVISLQNTGCFVHGARSKEMIAVPATSRAARPAWAGQIRVGGIDGGHGTNVFSGPNVSNNELKIALEQSLRDAGYLAADTTRASLTLTASIVAIDAPKFGGGSTRINSTLHYKVVNSVSGEIIFDCVVRAVGQRDESDASFGVTRRRMASEASVRANIETFLNRVQEVLDKSAHTTACPDSPQ